MGSDGTITWSFYLYQNLQSLLCNGFNNNLLCAVCKFVKL